MTAHIWLGTTTTYVIRDNATNELLTEPTTDYQAALAELTRIKNAGQVPITAGSIAHKLWNLHWPMPAEAAGSFGISARVLDSNQVDEIVKLLQREGLVS